MCSTRLLGAADFGRVIAVTRRPLGREHSRLANRIVQFERIEAQLKGVSCDVGAVLPRHDDPPGRLAASASARWTSSAVLAFARAAKTANARASS